MPLKEIPSFIVVFLSTGERPVALTDQFVLECRERSAVPLVFVDGTSGQLEELPSTMQPIWLEAIKKRNSNLPLVKQAKKSYRYDIGFNRTVALSMAKEYDCPLIMLDSDVDVNFSAVQRMIKILHEYDVVGGTINGEDSRDHLTAVTHLSSNALPIKMRSVASGGFFGFRPSATSLPFPASYNETWLWCVLCKSDGYQVIKREDCIGRHLRSTIRSDPSGRDIVGQQLGVLVYRLAWRLIDQSDGLHDLLFKLDEATNNGIPYELHPVRALDMAEEWLPNGLARDLRSSLGAVRWESLVRHWVAEYRHSLAAWRMLGSTVDLGL